MLEHRLMEASDGTWHIRPLREEDPSISLDIDVAAWGSSSRSDACRAALRALREVFAAHELSVTFHLVGYEQPSCPHSVRTNQFTTQLADDRWRRYGWRS